MGSNIIHTHEDDHMLEKCHKEPSTEIVVEEPEWAFGLLNAKDMKMHSPIFHRQPSLSK